MSSLGYRQILNQAWPIILANAAVPLLGLVDTAVMGHFGSPRDLAALAVATMIFNFLYWSFGFLRMGTTGQVAQYSGANDTRAVATVVLQSLMMAGGIAAVLIAVQWPLRALALQLLAPPAAVSGIAAEYFALRIWGAPATLSLYVISGVLIGRGQSKHLLWMQLCLNGSNAVLDLLFAGVFGMGAKGIALGTCLAEYLTALLGLSWLLRDLKFMRVYRESELGSALVTLKKLLAINGNLFIRTLFLLVAFAFFTRMAGGFGAEVLAANHILLQFISFSAFFLDGFAFVLESLAGKAYGARDRAALRVALYKSSVVAVGTALCLSLLLWCFGAVFIQQLTRFDDIAELAMGYLPLVAVYVLLSVAAFQLDGLFIGTSHSAAMRNCSVVSTLCFIASWYLLFDVWGNAGLWMAFVGFVVWRALTLCWYTPRVLRIEGE